jgi:hypothetical protein
MARWRQTGLHPEPLRDISKRKKSQDEAEAMVKEMKQINLRLEQSNWSRYLLMSPARSPGAVRKISSSHRCCVTRSVTN